MPLAIAEMALILALSAVGTVIEQGQSASYYAERYPNDGPAKVLGFVTARLIADCGLDHVYTTPYFLASGALLSASLAACSTTTQLPLVRVAQRWRYERRPAALRSLPVTDSLPRARTVDLAALLARRGYSVFLDPDGSLYGFKGLAGKLGPIGVHVSLLLILGGACLGALAGHTGSVMVPQGGDFVLADVLKPVGPLAGAPAPPGSRVRIDRFAIDYAPDGRVKQFYSDLTVLAPAGISDSGPGGITDSSPGDAGPGLREVARQTIFVNSPLRASGVTMYQTDWAIAALRLRATETGTPSGTQSGTPSGTPTVTASGTESVTPESLGPTFALPMASLEGATGITGRAWGTYLPLRDGPGGARRGLTVVARDLQSVAVYGPDGAFAGVRRPGSGTPLAVGGVTLDITELIGATGLELKVDPGVPYVYAGFGGLMFTVLVSYLSHAQVWAAQDGSTVHVGGKANRAAAAFRLEVESMLDQLPEVVVE